MLLLMLVLTTRINHKYYSKKRKNTQQKSIKDKEKRNHSNPNQEPSVGVV